MNPVGAPSFGSRTTNTVNFCELERALFEQGGARHVIANSRMVEKEIVSEFAYPQDKITVIYNGLPDIHFKSNPDSRVDNAARVGPPRE